MARRRNEVRKRDIFENMDTQSSSSEEKGHLQKLLKKTEVQMCDLLRHMQVIVVIVTYPCVLTLNRSCTHALYCATGRIYVVNPWEKGNVHGLEFDVMV